MEGIGSFTCRPATPWSMGMSRNCDPCTYATGLRRVTVYPLYSCIWMLRLFASKIKCYYVHYLCWFQNCRYFLQVVLASELTKYVEAEELPESLGGEKPYVHLECVRSQRVRRREVHTLDFIWDVYDLYRLYRLYKLNLGVDALL